MRGLGVLVALLLWLVLVANAPAGVAAVVLNEVNCEGTDWVELVNTSAAPVDLSGWLLTDDPLTSTRADHRLLFPASTTIAAGDDVVIEKGAAGFPFGISCGSDTIRLADAVGTLVDEIAVPVLVGAGDTWGRYPNGTGSWVETVPTKGTPNEPSTAAGGPPPDLAAWVFDPATVVGIDLTLPQASIDALGVDHTEYQDATFALTTTGGTYGPLAVGARLKGGVGSFRPLTGKAAFKLKFNHSVAGQRFLGLKKLTLNNMVQDKSMIHEALVYEAFRAVGIAAPRTGYAYVRVNGADYGLYLNVETLDDVSLGRWFDSTQHLYEGEYGTDVWPGDAGAFEVDEGSEADRADLEALIAAVNDAGGDWSERVDAFADLTQMTRMWAVEKYIGHWDGYAGSSQPNNYYVHSNSAGRFSMLPWGTDQTLVFRIAFDERNSLMFDGCLADASCAAMYRDAVADVAAAIATLNLDSRALATAALLVPWQELDPRRWYSMPQIGEAVTAVREFLAVRPQDAADWLGPPPAPGPPPPGDDPPLDTDSPPLDTHPPSLDTEGPLPYVLPPPPRGFGGGPAANDTMTWSGGLTVAPPSLTPSMVATHLYLPGAGRVTQHATMRIGRRAVTACVAGATRKRARPLSMRCWLTSAAKRRLAAGQLKLTVRTAFTPVEGSSEAIVHTVTGRP